MHLIRGWCRIKRTLEFGLDLGPNESNTDPTNTGAMRTLSLAV